MSFKNKNLHLWATHLQIFVKKACHGPTVKTLIFIWSQQPQIAVKLAHCVSVKWESFGGCLLCTMPGLRLSSPAWSLSSTFLPCRGSVRGERNSLAFLKFVNIYALICVYQFILHYLLLSNAVIFGVSWCAFVDKFPWSIPRTERFITNIWNLWLFKIKSADNLWENGKYPS